MDDNKKINLTPDDFKPVSIATSESEKMAVKSVSFWQDAGRRLLGDKAAVFSLIIIALLIIFSVLAPMKLFNQTNMNGTAFSYKHAPRVVDENGQETAKALISYLPPRIPGLEKLGIFDGTAKAEISNFDIIVGYLPKTDEFLELGKPQNRQALTERLGIPYHPFDIMIDDIYEDDQGVLQMTYTVNKTKQQETKPYEEMISEFSIYKAGTFSLIDSKTDEFGSNMVMIRRNLYKIQNVGNLYFWFGTDKSAFDNWTRLWVGIRVSLLIALAAVIFDFGIGITYGTISGFYTGTWIDNVMMRFAEIIGSIPFFVFLFIFVAIKDQISVLIKSIGFHFLSGHIVLWLFIIFLAYFVLSNGVRFARKKINREDLIQKSKNFIIVWAIIGAIQLLITWYASRATGGISRSMIDIETTSLIIIVFALSITGWIGVARMVRAQIIKLRDQEFVLAARTLGAGSGRIMKKHLFPNIIGQLVVLGTFKIPSAIFAEAFMTFLGLGLPIPMASLGVLVFRGYEAIKTQPTLLFIPAFFMSILMLAINLLANGLRDALDPRMR